MNSKDVLNKGRTLVSMLTGNADYPTLQAQLPALSAACDALASAIEEADFNGGKLAHQDKRSSEEVVRKHINALVPQVQTISGGDEGKILAAGFDVARTPEAYPAPAEPQDFQALLTAYKRAIKLRWSKVKFARYYQVQMMDKDGNYEVVVTTTRSRHMLVDLAPGAYTLRVVAVGSGGTSPFSESIIANAA